MHCKSLNQEYRGKVYISHLDIYSDITFVPAEYLLYGFQELDPEDKKRWNILHGEFEELGKVTFLDCFQVLYLNNRGLFTGAIQFIKLFTGTSIQDHTQKFISSVTLWSAALNEWFCEDLSLLEKHLGSTHPLHVVEMEAEDLQIKVVWNGDLGSYNENTVPVIEIEMLFLKPLSIYEFGVLHHKLQNLILFLTNDDPTLHFLHYNEAESFVIRKVQEFNRDWFTNAVEFSFAEIAQELGTIFQNWFGYPKMDNIRDLLLERKYNIDLSKERYFLNMCVALESFHNRFVKKNVSLGDHSILEKRVQIKSYLAENPELQKWFLEKSSHWKNPTLFDRLIDLKNDYSQVVQDLFKIPIEELIRKVKKCRDHLAHDGEYTMIFQDEVELFLVGYSLEMVLSVLLYKFHGVTEDSTVQKLYSYTHWNLNRLCKLNNYKGLNQ